MKSTLVFLLSLLAIDATANVATNYSFVSIKAGTFPMGSPTSENNRYNDEVLHDVTISRDFEIQSTLVTQAQYVQTMKHNPSVFKGREHCKSDYVVVRGTALCPNNPVDSVSKDEAEQFIKNLNARDAKFSYRLPTEAEWEYSARAGSQDAYWFGNEAAILGNYAWISGNSNNMTHDVRSKPANSWGIYDTHGNLHQWVSDWYGKYDTSPQKDPEGPDSLTADGHYRTGVIRGGSWLNGSDYTESGRSAYRGTLWRSIGDPQVGFRLVRVHK